ncbi:Nn.00g097170.m01.CDS01 [Neocucurbitaria sp. VM-36]
MGSIVQKEQQVAIVTGSTARLTSVLQLNSTTYPFQQSGIGSWLAAHLHARGYRVALCGRREKKGREIASYIDASGESAIYVQCDVKSYESQVNLFKRVWEEWGRLDVLIANAGCVDRGSVYNFARRDAAINNLPSEPDTTCTDIDFKGMIYGTTLATHFMRHNAHGKGGKIIVTGSCYTSMGQDDGPYTTEKGEYYHQLRYARRYRDAAMPGFSKAFLREQMTLRSNLFAGYDTFLDDETNSRSGETLEAAHDKLINWGHPGYKSGAFAKRTEAVFEPWFELMHGERSELPGALLIAVAGATGS